LPRRAGFCFSVSVSARLRGVGRLRTVLFLCFACGASLLSGGCGSGHPYLNLRNALDVAAVATRADLPVAMSAAVRAYCTRCNGEDLPLDPIVCGPRESALVTHEETPHH
jgi:hypothetical protein